MPQKGLSRLAGWLAQNTTPWLKTFLINYFLSRYDVNLEEAIDPNPQNYKSFNEFFTRALKPQLRPISPFTHELISPVDGTISQITSINKGSLIQAKGFSYSLESLFANKLDFAKPYINGSFLTAYLAPKDYHRIHMPLEGKLLAEIYVPGKLFSVNPKTARTIPDLFARNERLITIFKAPQGHFALILVGAMLVGSIESIWGGVVNPQHSTLPYTKDLTHLNLTLKKGEEMGRFKLGSTIILLLENNMIEWLSELTPGLSLLMGQPIGKIKQAHS
ncbi:MAG: phosphatidylserine decarboxylase precursor [Francisellaceae bacterium]|nr:phosphatidylserine decarboxylase precursor [Francisellaceae bacterium]